MADAFAPFGFAPADIDPLTGAPMPAPLAPRRKTPIDDAYVVDLEKELAGPNRIAQTLGQGMKQWIEGPGERLWGTFAVQPEVPGQISEADVFREQQAARDAATWGAGTAFGMVAGSRLPGGAAGSGMAKLAQPEGIRAYHGSPHDFDRFDLGKIGTGEGAQAYGHGLYFAENEGVARQYRDTLAPSRSKLPDDVVSMPMDSRRSFMAQVATDADPLTAAKRAQYGASALRAEDVNKLAGLISDVRQAQQGRMYEVNIGAKPEQFLDWDKPLSQQPDVVKTLVGGAKHPEDWVPNPEVTGSKYWADTQGGPSDRSAFMRERGIPGIRYLDQGSRNKFQTDAAKARGERFTSNYVVFDPGIIDIMRKYALPGMAGGGAAFGSLAPEGR